MSDIHSEVKEIKKPNLYVLDTNVLMHDPTAIFRFQEHDVFIPMVVLEELDHNKKGLTEVARNARETSRILDALIRSNDVANLKQGILLGSEEYPVSESCKGKLRFQMKQLNPSDVKALGDLAGSNKNDNSILGVVLALHEQKNGYTEVILVSKDINVRIKAAFLEIKAEDYYNDQSVEDIDLLYSGIVDIDFRSFGNLDSWQKGSQVYYQYTGPMVQELFPKQFISCDEGDVLLIVDEIKDGSAILKIVSDFSKKTSVWGISPKNTQQRCALHALMDPDIDFVTILGTAGTGKTLLALAAGLSQIKESKVYDEIIMTRETVPIGEDIGFLPGSEEEKMAPWMGALMDNLELLGSCAGGTENERGMSSNLIMNKVKMRSLNFMRGRTFLKRYVIIDEAQNLTSKQLKTLITRAGPGTKIVCIGNLSQIDTPYLSAVTSGLTYVVERFKPYSNGTHIVLSSVERSRLADFSDYNL